MRKRLIRDMEAMEQGMQRTADRCDIWQDRLIYAICRAIYDVIMWILKSDDKKGDDDQWPKFPA